MAFVVPIGAVAVAGLSAYGLWRHTQREDSEAPSALDKQQEIGPGGDNKQKGTRYKVLYGLTKEALDKYFGAKAQEFLINVDWINEGTSDDETYIAFAGTSEKRSVLSRMTGLEIMQAVNGAAARDGAQPPYDFNKALPKPVAQPDFPPKAAAVEPDPAAC